MYIRQYKAVVEKRKILTQRIFTGRHGILGKYNDLAVAIGVIDGEIGVSFFNLQRPVPVDYLEDGLSWACLRSGERDLYEVGKVYTVMHKRGLPAVRVFWPNGIDIIGSPIVAAPMSKEEAESYDRRGWHKLTIRITKIRFGRLQKMTDKDVQDEGVNSREEYIALWNSINGPAAWDLNPWVTRIGFECAEAQLPLFAPPSKTMTGKDREERRVR